VTDHRIATGQADNQQSGQPLREHSEHDKPPAAGNTERNPMSQYRSAYRTQPARDSRLKSLATKIAVAALMITGSAGIAVAATSSSTHPAAPITGPHNPPTCQPGYVLLNNICVIQNT
jgi:hypothetical protein